MCQTTPHTPTRHPPAWRHLLVATLLLAAPTAWAATSILIWPINPLIEGDRKAAALWLENRGEKPVSLQVRVFDWHQRERTDGLEPQRAVVGSPPVTEVQPGKQQMVRLILREPVSAGREHAYRVLVDEMLTPDSQGNADLGVQFQMRYSVPLFVIGSGARVDLRGTEEPGRLRPQLRYRISEAGGTRYLSVRNVGDAHARLSAVRLVQGSRAFSISDGLLGYVLAGAEMRWPLPREMPAGAGVLEARVNDADQPVRLAAD